MDLTEDDLGKTLRRYLQPILDQKVSLERYETQQNVRIMMEVHDGLVEAMKKVDPLFNEIYQASVHTGSYYERLRIESANEFDLNMVLRLPFNYRDVKVELCEYDPAYVTYQLNNNPKDLLRGHQKLKDPFDKILEYEFFNQQNFLQQHKITRWIQSIFSRAIDRGTFEKPPEVQSIKRSRGGPAFTFYITTIHGETIDVDLVPVIDLALHNRPSDMNPGNRFYTVREIHKEKWFLVPKPFKPQNTSSSTDNEEFLTTRYWRMSFPEVEKQLLRNTGCLRKLIKLFKFLRDCNEYWRKPIASYYIKTFFLLEYEKYEEEEWKDINLGTKYLQMLRKLQAAVEIQEIPFYFNREGNLLSSMKECTGYNIARRIEHILKVITRTPASIKKFYNIFPNSPESNYVDAVAAVDTPEVDWRVVPRQEGACCVIL